MKKLMSLVMVLALMLVATAAFADGEITVVSREDGSGTRGAFVELMGILDADGDDATTDTAEVTNSTSVMMTTVAGNTAAIGYVSLGSLSTDVKALKVDGVEASVENVLNGSYTIARPFNICYQDGLSEIAQDFIAYIMSAEGQTIISDNGYISIASDAAAYTGTGMSGKVTLAGSTSVSPVMEKLVEAYQVINPDVEIEIQQSGSSAGIQSATEGVCDIGMSSRELKDSELEAGLTVETIARDGIAVIANLENAVEDITSEQIRSIYLGELTSWSEIG